MMLKTAFSILGRNGPRELVRAIVARVAGKRLARRFDRLRGFEIGGPSPLFQRTGLIPVYAHAHLDNCTFARNTVWAKHPGPEFLYDAHRPAGRQFIGEATRLDFAADEQYDFVVSADSLEHIANPLKALAEWRRILKPGGLLLLVVPHHEGTFDRRREVTPFAHLIEDWQAQVGEEDLTHLPEILERHDLTRDPEAGDFESFRQRALKNVDNRCLHHHVFNTELAVRMVDWLCFCVLAVLTLRPYAIAVLSEKPADHQAVDNGPWFRHNRLWRRWSPFESDRQPGPPSPIA